MKMLATRDGYGAALASLGEKYDFYVFDADLSKTTKTDAFKEKFPDRFFSAGIAEANMMGMAAGFAACGKTVFATTFAIFAAGRAFEQVRNSIAYTNLNVKVVGTHAGILIGEDGASHQAIEDIALMRSIPNMTVLCPSDYTQSIACVEEAIKHQGPVYLRFGRNPSPIIYEKSEFEIGKGHVLKDGSDLTIVAIGDMVFEALEAAKLLEEENISTAVIDMPSIKPIDKELILKYAKKTGLIVTSEDHNIMGGLGSAVCEVLAEKFQSEYRIPVIRTGVKDVFGRSGKKDDLAKFYGLNAERIKISCKQAFVNMANSL